MKTIGLPLNSLENSEENQWFPMRKVGVFR